MKKEERLQRKKMKMAALANIIQINKKDQQALKNKEEFHENENSDEEQPSMKKMRTVNQISNGGEISDEQFKQLKKEVSQHKNAPKFRLKFFGDAASIKTHPARRQPLFFDDIHNLLMRAILKYSSPAKPDRWSVLEKPAKIAQTVVMVINGPTTYNFSANESQFPNLNAIFPDKFELVLSKQRVLEELILIPWIQANKTALTLKYGSLDAAFMLLKNPSAAMDQFFDVEDDNDSRNSPQKVRDKFPRTQLLLSPMQMLIEGYPMPSANNNRYQNYRATKIRYKPVTPYSKMFGLDCEMVQSIRAENELARVSIVDENYQSVYETLVRPECKVKNYLTQWSGMTKEILMTATKTLKEVQDDVCNLLPPDAILVGQSLNCDLNAMKLMHPYVIDTSIIYNLSGIRAKKSKLQMLAKRFLGKDIQLDKSGHSSLEDSTACIQLTKLKLSQSICFGDNVLQSRREPPPPPMVNNIRHMSTEIIPTKQFHSTLVTSQNSNLILSNNMRHFIQAVEHKEEPTVKNAIHTVRKIATSSDYVVSYINVLDEMTAIGQQTDKCSDDDDEKISKYAANIDKWIYKIWGKMPDNGLLVVIFGGRENSNANGLAMVKIKT